MKVRADAFVIPLPGRVCPGEGGLCCKALRVCVLRKTRTGFSLRWWCKSCLPAKYR